MKRLVLRQNFVSVTGRRAAHAALTFVVVLGAAIISTFPARAQTYKETLLHTFTGGHGANPEAALIRDAKGNLYGTTVYGGASGVGTVFKLSSNGRETVLYSFTGGADGKYPTDDLIMDAKGHLYSTTLEGGASGAGTVFKLSGKGRETVLYSFTGGVDGASPSGGLIMDADGNLYGVTTEGGASGAGTVFKVSGKGTETVLYSFTGGADGKYPTGGLIMGAEGNLYGTTLEGGASGAGTVFTLTKKGAETVLYSFTGGADGALPGTALIMDAKGDLYGSAWGGGSHDACSLGCGTVFKVSSKGKETTLYIFTGGTDGQHPDGSLILDAKGNLYSTTSYGGRSGDGVVFKVSGKATETVLYSFTGGASGANPYAGLIVDAKGNLYGTTIYGGAAGLGTIFKLTP
jgi:uncharacterized repeat protein (TIGR03803 family)